MKKKFFYLLCRLLGETIDKIKHTMMGSEGKDE